MMQLTDLTLWLLTTFAEAFVVYLFLIQGLFRKFVFLSFYLLISVTINISRYAVLTHFGLASSEYAYFYYFADVLLTLFLFLSVCELSVHLVGTKISRTRVMMWSVGALFATTWFSFTVVSPSAHLVITRFVVELSQDILFACCLGIVLLWVWRLRNDPEDWTAARLVSVLSVYFSLFILNYGARQLVPHVSGLTNSLSPMIAAWLPLGCGFVLVSHEESRRTKP
jgi:hypothetical protein